MPIKKPADWSKGTLMEPTDDVGGPMMELNRRALEEPGRLSGELLRRRRLIAVAGLVGTFAIFGFVSVLLKMSPSGSAQLRNPHSHSPASTRRAPADGVTATFSATLVAKPNMKVTTTQPRADSPSADVVAIGPAALDPIASTTTPETTTVRVEASVHAAVTEPRPVIGTDTTPMSVPSNETFTIINP